MVEGKMAEQFLSGYALLIGVNENINPTWALPDVEKDVSALQKVLVHPERCAYLQDNVKVILDKDSTRQNILGGLTWLKKKINDDASGNATAVVFYSGHGDRDDSQDPQYYLIPYDVDIEAFKSSALRAEDFADAINALKPQRLFVVLDCCHSGGMGVKGVAAYRQSAIPVQIFIPEAKGVSPREGAKGLEVLTRGSGRAVLSSSQGEQVSYLRKDGKMSIFTYHLIEAMTGHAQPQEGATEVLVSDVMSFVWRKVPESAKAEYGAPQEPDYQVSGNFPIALLLGGKGITKGLSAPDPLAPLTSDRAGTGTIINTGGGAYVAGKVSVGGDFVGRDKVVHGDEVRGDKIGGDKITVGGISGQGVAIGRGAQATVTTGISGHELQRLFEPVIKSIREMPNDNQTEALKKAEELKQEVAKGKAADDSKMGKLIDGLIGLVPSAISGIASIFASPILGGFAGPVTKYVLEKIQGKQ
jgi:Caspase domain